MRYHTALAEGALELEPPDEGDWPRRAHAFVAIPGRSSRRSPVSVGVYVGYQDRYGLGVGTVAFALNALHGKVA